MTRNQYRNARRLIRDNGRAAYAWIAKTYGWVMADKLRDLNDAQDWLKERADIVAYCHREGTRCTPRDTRPIREYRVGNSGPEVIADSSVGEGWDTVMAVMNEYTDKMEASQ